MNAALTFAPIRISAPDPFSSLVLFFSFQLPFGEGLFHFYPQDTSKRRSKRSAHRRQPLQKDKRVRIHVTRENTILYVHELKPVWLLFSHDNLSIMVIDLARPKD